MKRIFYVLTFALLASCNNVVDLQQVENENAEGRLPQVTVINQLGEVTPLLASAVAQSQYVATSRGEAMPEIESIEMIKDSKGNPAIYIVNNANNQGFTLISATMDYSPIIATSDEGHFSWEAAQQCGAGIVVGEGIQAIEHVAELPDSIRLKFNAAWEQYNTSKEELKLPQSRSSEDVYNFIRYKVGQWESQGYTVHTVENYMSSSSYASLPADVRYQIQDLPYAYANPNYGGIYNVSFVLIKDVTTSNRSHLISTEWHQENPYSNNLNPNSISLGCGVVAVGQIMNYYNPVDTDSIPEFLAKLREDMGLARNNPSPYTSINVQKNIFRTYGYAPARLENHDFSVAVNEIRQGHPIIMTGQDVVINDGHSWIADGLAESTSSQEIKLMCLEDCPSGYSPSYFENPYNYSLYRGSSIMFHMNWGYGEDTFLHVNGYYYDNDIDFTVGNGTLNFNSSRQDIINIRP